jgi:hypothetical protein
MKYILTVLLASIFLSGCASSLKEVSKKQFSPGEILRAAIGNSTLSVEEARKTALVKVFKYDYQACYAKVEGILKTMPNISIYYQDEGMIAVFYLNPNTTPVGMFFTKIDDGNTKVEISSPASPAKEWVAKNVFSETALPAEIIKKPRY